MYYYFYKITNLINGKYYYGVHHTNNLDDGYMGSGKVLRKAQEKYGIENFKKEIIRYFEDIQSMFEYEKKFITQDIIDDHNCYNIAFGGKGGNLIAGLSDEEKQNYSLKLSEAGKKSYNENPARAINHSKKMKEYYSIQENKDKLREIMKPIIKSERYRKKMSNSHSGEKNGMYGYQWNEKQRNAMCETMTEVWKDPVHKQNLLDGLSRRGDEWRKHISEAHKGKKLSDKHKQSISEANKGRIKSKEEREKISNALKGKKQPKISEALRGKPSGTSGKHWKTINGKRVYY